MMSFTDEAWGKPFPLTTAEGLRAMAREIESPAFVLIEPGEARKLLADLGRKPVIAPTRVAKYQREMSRFIDESRGRLGCVRVGISRDGRLGDGDTLLTAVARYERPVLLAVRFGLNEPAIEHFDAPKKRESHAVQSAGIKDAARVSALANLLLEYAVGREMEKKPRLSAEAIIVIANEDEHLRFAIDNCMKFRSPLLKGVPGALCLYVAAGAAGQDKAQAFLDLDRGARCATQAHDPVLMLRDRLHRESGRRKPEPRETQIGWCLDAVTRHLAGVSSERPGWKRGPWPRIPALVMPDIIEREAARIRGEIDASVMRAA